jgi:hypothetical protein
MISLRDRRLILPHPPNNETDNQKKLQIIGEVLSKLREKMMVDSSMGFIDLKPRKNVLKVDEHFSPIVDVPRQQVISDSFDCTLVETKDTYDLFPFITMYTAHITTYFRNVSSGDKINTGWFRFHAHICNTFDCYLKGGLVYGLLMGDNNAESDSDFELNKINDPDVFTKKARQFRDSFIQHSLGIKALKTDTSEVKTGLRQVMENINNDEQFYKMECTKIRVFNSSTEDESLFPSIVRGDLHISPLRGEDTPKAARPRENITAQSRMCEGDRKRLLYITENFNFSREIGDIYKIIELVRFKIPFFLSFNDNTMTTAHHVQKGAELIDITFGHNDLAYGESIPKSAYFTYKNETKRDTLQIMSIEHFMCDLYKVTFLDAGAYAKRQKRIKRLNSILDRYVQYLKYEEKSATLNTLLNSPVIEWCRKTYQEKKEFHIDDISMEKVTPTLLHLIQLIPSAPALPEIQTWFDGIKAANIYEKNVDEGAAWVDERFYDTP